MSIELKKRVLDLRKRAHVHVVNKGLDQTRAQVVLVLDISKSMNRLYQSGIVQSVIERMLALALDFDDDGKIDVVLFGTQAYQLPSVSLDDLEGYVERVILSTYKIVEATRYATALRLLYDKYRGNRSHAVLVIFVTDGNNSDKKETTDLLCELSKEKIFFQFVGIGGEDFPFLKRLDTLSGRLLDNAGFMPIADISTVADDDLYAHILAEFPQWIASGKQIGLFQ